MGGEGRLSVLKPYLQDIKVRFNQANYFSQFTGMLVAFVGVGGVYFLPRAWPAFYDFVGMPGF